MSLSRYWTLGSIFDGCEVCACAQEFAEFAAARDVSEAVPGRTPLELPYAIDGDRVGNLTIKLMFNKARLMPFSTSQRCVKFWRALKPIDAACLRHSGVRASGAMQRAVRVVFECKDDLRSRHVRMRGACMRAGCALDQGAEVHADRPQVVHVLGHRAPGGRRRPAGAPRACASRARQGRHEQRCILHAQGACRRRQMTMCTSLCDASHGACITV